MTNFLLKNVAQVSLSKCGIYEHTYLEEAQ